MGEGLQHDDGHSHVLSSVIPSCVSYDPTYNYELAVIIHDGLRRMYVDQEDIYYYITVLNENYPQPALPEGVEAGILKGLYLLHPAAADSASQPRVQLMGSGSILREVEAAAKLLLQDFGIASDVWSATSLTELRRDGRLPNAGTCCTRLRNRAYPTCRSACRAMMARWWWPPTT